MKKYIRIPFALALLGLAAALLPAPAAAQAPDLLTYQGRLKENGTPVNGVRDVEILLWDQMTGGTGFFTGVQGVSISSGLFRTTFTVPSGVDLRTGQWYLEVKVGAQTLSPRERLTSSPYAVLASSAMTLTPNAVTGAVVVPDARLILGEGGDGAPNALILVGASESSASVKLHNLGAGSVLGDWRMSVDGAGAWSLRGQAGALGALRTEADGDVGVGTTSPDARLHVSSGTGWAGDVVTVSTGTSSLIRMTGLGEVFAHRFIGDGSGLTNVAGGGGGGWLDSGAAVHLADPTDLVGVGTTVPTSTMTIKGALGFDGVGQPETQAGRGLIYYDPAGNKLKVSENGAGFVDLLSGGGWTDSINGPIMDDGGKGVAIGTTLPHTRLHVAMRDGATFPGELLKLSTGGIAGTASTHLLVRRDGRIGVGMDAPFSTMTVRGALGFDAINEPEGPAPGRGIIYFDGTNFRVSENNGSFNNLIGSKWNDSGGILYPNVITNLVGIGNSSPEAALDAANQAGVPFLLAVSSGPGGDVSKRVFTVDANGHAVLVSSLTVGAGVGIGTTVPLGDSHLLVQGTATAKVFNMPNFTDSGRIGGLQVFQVAPTPDVALHYGYGTANTVSEVLRHAFYVGGTANATEKLRVTRDEGVSVFSSMTVTGSTFSVGGNLLAVEEGRLALGGGILFAASGSTQAAASTWQFLGKHRAAGGEGSLSVQNLPARRYLRVIARVNGKGPSSGASTLRFNNDTGSNYYYRQSSDGGADSSLGGQGSIPLGPSGTGPEYITVEIVNDELFNKLVTAHAVEDNGAAIPNRTETVGLWNDNTALITRIDLVTAGTQLEVDSELQVYGHD